MEFPFHHDIWLENSLRRIARDLWPEVDFNPLIRLADPRNGHYQANGVLPLAKALKQAPRKLAEALAEKILEDGSLAKAFTFEVAGPGFINFTFTSEWLVTWLSAFCNEEQMAKVGGSELQHQRIIIDFSSPNTAKQMHVGHIRSTVIGESLARLLEFEGHDVSRDNHIGDWGTGFGILLMQMRRENIDLDNCGENPLEFIEGLYKRGNALAESDTEAKEEARAAVLALQQGDPEATRAWKRINELSYAAFDRIYKALGVHFDMVLGESFYCDKVDQVYQELTKHKIAEESQGALVVFHPEHPRFNKQPFMIRKANGASNYATTDLATILYRVEELEAERIVYVVDSRQSDHFEQLFLTVEKWFKATGRPVPKMEHVSFGTILGKDGRAIKTRSGTPVLLSDVAAESIRRAGEIVAEKNPNLSEDERAEVARVVGINAVRYADLSQNRTSDYVFDWDKLLSFEGNTAPYLLYAGARIHGIFRRLEVDEDGFFGAEGGFETEGELKLAAKIAQFGTALDMTTEDLRPHVLGNYLFELCTLFSSFYDSNKVAVDEKAVRDRRLLLCQKTLLVLETGLHLLGIPTLKRM